MDNPYASPTQVVDDESTRKKAFRPFSKALTRWTVICFISAAPSFFWGCTLGHAPEHLLAMFAGIGCFVLAYAFAECSEVYQSYRANPMMRRTLFLGFGARLAASIAFPFGLYLDMVVGVLSVNVANWFFRTNLAREKQEGLFAFASFFVTTLLQGLLMNVLLFTLMVLIYGAQWIWMHRIIRPCPETDATESTGTL